MSDENANISKQESKEVRYDTASLSTVNSEVEVDPEDQFKDYDVKNKRVQAHPLDVLNNARLDQLLRDLQRDYSHLKTENKLFYDYLAHNEPGYLEGLNDLVLFFSMNMATRASMVTSGVQSDSRFSLPARSSRRSIKSFVLMDPTASSTVAGGRVTKINLTQKTDMVVRAIEDIQTHLQTFEKKSHVSNRVLRGQLEEFDVRETELRASVAGFEYQICQAVDALTGRIPAEKFIKYMQDWLKNAGLTLEKLRLRTASLKVQNSKVTATLIRRKELRENVTVADFDKLEIENNYYKTKLSQKIDQCHKLEKLTITANFVLREHTKYLFKQNESYERILQLIEERERNIFNLENECDILGEEMEKAEAICERVRTLKDTYTVPEVMEYVTLKRDLNEIKKKLKKERRRKEIQEIGFGECIRGVQVITGATVLGLDWLQDSNERLSVISQFPSKLKHSNMLKLKLNAKPC